MTPAQAGEMLGGCRRELFEARAQRPRPSLDDKVRVCVCAVFREVQGQLFGWEVF